MRLSLWDLSNVILKLGFRRAFDGTVLVIKKNSMCIEFAMYLLSFSVEIEKVYLSSSGSRDFSVRYQNKRFIFKKPQPTLLNVLFKNGIKKSNLLVKFSFA